MSLFDDVRSYLTRREDEAPKTVEARADSWGNLRTGLGVSGSDPSVDSFFSCQLVSRPQLTELYRCSGIAAKVIERPAVDATRQWVTFAAGETDEEAAQFDEGVQKELKSLNAQWALTQALIWARLYGAGMILVHFENEDPSEPIPETGALRRIERLEVRAGGWNSYFFPVWDNDSVRDCEGIIGYTYQPPYGPVESWHADRVIRIDQTHLTEKEMIAQYCWGDGIVPRLWDALRDEGTAFGAAGRYLQTYQYPVWKIKGLISKVLGNGAEKLKRRYRLATQSRSQAKAIVLDMDQEELEDRTLNLSGLPQLLDKFPTRVSAVSGIPMTLLYGISPGGLNATGDSDIRQYYDMISATVQEFQLRPALEALTSMVLRQIDGPSRGVEPENWRMVFRSLWQLTDLEEAQLRKTNAEADVAYVNASVLMPEEVADSRFGGSAYGTEIYLDQETREMMKEDDQPELVPGQEPRPEDDDENSEELGDKE